MKTLAASIFVLALAGIAVSQERDQALEDAVTAALKSEKLDKEVAEVIAIDGKTLKGARREDGTQVHLLSAFLQTQGVTVAQKEVGAKTNEIPELRDLLAPLHIEGQVVSADALHTQRETARFLVEDKKADYIFTVKDNQGTVLDDIAALDWESFPPGG